MAGGRATTTGRRVLLAVGAAVVLIGVVIVATVPRGERETSFTLDTSTDAAVQVRILVESIDANRGTMQVSVAAAPGAEAIPEGGVSVLTDIEGLPPLHVEPDALVAVEGDAPIRFDKGTVGAYPFDHYDGTISLIAVKGTPKTLGDIVDPTIVPMSIVLVDGSTGFELDASANAPAADDPLPIAEVDYAVGRTLPVLVWSSVMMGIYWLLTAAIVAVTVVTLLGYREWETRHLAWLAAMIFAFTSFRAAAPGSPPIGVYFDFVSFFWAEMIVALCLAALVANYLVGRNIAGLEGPALDGAAGVGGADAGDPGPDERDDTHR